MPNWCSTNFTFEGKKDEILEFHKKLNKIISKGATAENNSNNGWLGNIVIGYGFDPQEVRCRGSVDDVPGDVVVKGGSAYFSLSTTSAWEPLTDMWDLIIKRYYPSVSYVYLAIEHGTKLYLNTDTSGKHYNEKYLLDLCIPEKVFGKQIDTYEFYEDLEELLADLKQLTGKRFENIEKAVDFLRNKVEGVEEDWIIAIGEFTAGDEE